MFSNTAYAPFEFKDSDQVYKGIDVEILDKVAEINGWTLEKSFPGFDAAVNAVQAGQADAIMAGMTKTKEREQVLPSLIPTIFTKVVVRLKLTKLLPMTSLKIKTVGVRKRYSCSALPSKNKDKYGYTIGAFDTSDLMNHSLSFTISPQEVLLFPTSYANQYITRKN